MLQPGLFDIENRPESLSKFGNPLEKLKDIVNFEVFRAEIEEGLKFKDNSKGGCSTTIAF